MGGLRKQPICVWFGCVPSYTMLKSLGERYKCIASITLRSMYIRFFWSQVIGKFVYIFVSVFFIFALTNLICYIHHIRIGNCQTYIWCITVSDNWR